MEWWGEVATCILIPFFSIFYDKQGIRNESCTLAQWQPQEPGGEDAPDHGPPRDLPMFTEHRMTPILNPLACLVPNPGSTRLAMS